MTTVLNEAMAPEMTLSLMDLMNVEPFSMNVDGSNDNDVLEMYPLHLMSTGGRCVSDFLTCVHPLFQLLVFTKLDEALTKHGLELSRCAGFYIDNINVNVESVLERNESVEFMDYTCDNCASHSSKAFCGSLKM